MAGRTAPRSVAAVVAVALAVALVPLGWGLFFARLAGLGEHRTIDAVAVWTVLGAGALATLVLLRGLPLAAAGLVAGFLVAPAVAHVLGAPALVGAFVYGTALVPVAWLGARSRPISTPPAGVFELGMFFRGKGGAALVLLTPALIGFVAFAELAGWIRILFTLAVLVSALTSLRGAREGWRVVAGFIAALSFALLVFEVLLFYDVYPLLPVALAAGVGFVVAIPYFLAATSGRVPVPRRR